MEVNDAELAAPPPGQSTRLVLCNAALTTDRSKGSTPPLRPANLSATEKGCHHRCQGPNFQEEFTRKVFWSLTSSEHFRWIHPGKHGPSVFRVCPLSGELTSACVTLSVTVGSARDGQDATGRDLIIERYLP
jgi:hypothetical protein